MTPTSPPQPKIEMQNVAKAFGDNQVLRDVSLSVAAEESLAIIGTSGCGKSVTLKCLLGLLRADSGSIRVDGQELIHATRADLESVRRRFGITFLCDPWGVRPPRSGLVRDLFRGLLFGVTFHGDP